MQKQVAATFSGVAQKHAFQSFGSKLASTLGPLGALIENVSNAPPDTERSDSGLGSKPKFMGRDIWTHRVRPEIGKASGVEEAKAPERWRRLSMGPKAAGNGGDRADATLNYAVLLWVARGSRLKSNAQRAIEGLHVRGDEFPTVVTCDLANWASMTN